MTIRRLRPADRHAYLALRYALWPDDEPAYHEREIDHLLAKRHPIMPVAAFVAENAEGQLVGFAEVTLRPFVEGSTNQPVGYLEGWYVVPAFRKKGFGRGLAEACRDWAAEQGCTEFASDCHLDNAAGQAACLALGFVETHRLIHFRQSLL